LVLSSFHSGLCLPLLTILFYPTRSAGLTSCHCPCLDHFLTISSSAPLSRLTSIPAPGPSIFARLSPSLPPPPFFFATPRQSHHCTVSKRHGISFFTREGETRKKKEKKKKKKLRRLTCRNNPCRLFSRLQLGSSSTLYHRAKPSTRVAGNLPALVLVCSLIDPPNAPSI